LNAQRLVESYAADLVHGVTRGKVMTAKHFLIGLGLHSITGQKKPIQLLNRLGHSIDYNMVCEIETAHAQANQKISETHGTLPLSPATDEHAVLTFFWADNFDMNLETQTGHGAINSTHMIAFQEESQFTMKRSTLKVKFARTGKRSIEQSNMEGEEMQVNPKKEPPSFVNYSADEIVKSQRLSAEHFLMWMIFRLINFGDQNVTSYFAWEMQNRIAGENNTVQKTLTTYLPPINAKVTEFSTINQYLTYMQKLANEVNMPYVNVCLDLGATMNAYKFIWNFPLKFNNVVIHLGDFHFIKENFGVIGRLVEASGFEDVVYQAGVCSYGSLAVHSAFSEALERLLFQRFLKENSIAIPDYFYDACIDPIASCAVITENASSLYSEYQAFKEEARNGVLGKTAQFWIQFYMDLMECQRTAHLAVQENDFVQRLLAWKLFLPMYFVLNKQNYARYASYYGKY
jgi:hypothetical protein